MNKIRKITWSATLLAILALALPAGATLTNIVCNPADYTCQPSGVNNPVASTTDAIGFAGSPGSSWCAVLMFPLPTLPAGKQIGPQTTMAVNLSSVGASTTINADVWGVANFRATLPGSTPDSTYSYYLVNNTGPGNNSTPTDVKLVDNFLTPSLVGKAGIYVMTPTGTTNNLQAYIQSFYTNNPTYDASVAQAYVWLRINSDTASTSTANRYVINAGDSGVTSTLRPVLNLDIVDMPTSTVTWNGDASAVWDINTTANWKSNEITSLTYQDGDNVVFDDTLTANPGITLNTTVSPASTLIAGTNYIFSGSGKISGSGSLTKAGTGTAILDTDNDYSGATFVAGGTLQVGNGDTHGSLGSGPVTNTGVGAILAFNRTDAITVNSIVTRSYQYNATVVVNSGIVNLAGAGDNSGTLAIVNTNGTLVLAKASGSTAHTLGSSSAINPGGTMQLGGTGGDQIFQNAYITNNGTFDMAGLNEGINGLFGNGLVTNSVVTPSTLALGDGNGSASFAGVIKDGAGTVGLTKTGTGTQTLTGTNNTYSGNTTINAGVLAISTGASGGNFTVADNATLGVNTVSSNGTLAINTLTLGNSKITLQLQNSTTIAPIGVSNLVLNGTVTINITSTNTFFPSQSYPLIGYTNLTGSPSFVLGTLPSGVSGTLDTSGSPIKFIVATVPVTWNGNVSGVWDIATTPNWKFGTLTGLTYPDGDPVTFDDTLAGTTNVILNTSVSPLSVTVTNNTHGYIMTGPGNITGTGRLTKSGTNTLIVDTDNDYIGGTVVLGGTLQIGNNDTHGTLGFGPTTNLTGGAIIAFNRTDTIDVGTITRTTVDNSARVVVNSGTVNLGGTGDNAGTIGIVNNGGTLVLAKDSSAAVHALSSFSPFLQINAGGTMQLGGFGEDQIYMSSGLTDNGVFDMAGHNEGFDMLAGNGLVTCSGGASQLELGQNNGSSTFSGAIVDGSGNLSLSKVGLGTLTLTGANTYTGDTLVSTGKLVTATASTGGGAYIINDAAAFGVSVSTPNGSLVTSSLALGASGDSTLEFQNLNSTTTAAINASSLALNSAVTINITSGTFVAGQNYPLLAYSGVSGSGTFTLGTLPDGITATLKNDASPITLQVSSVVNPTPPILTTAVTNNTLTLQWPTDHTGWLLQSNAVGLTANDQWFAVPGSTTTNAIGLPIDPSATNVFYRLRF